MAKSNVIPSGVLICEVKNKIIPDICGECGGDNSSCYEISGQVTSRPIDGYLDILEIPKGAMNINIWKERLRLINGTYFFLGKLNRNTDIKLKL